MQNKKWSPKWAAAGIVLTSFWLVMTGLLIRREIIGPASFMEATGKRPSFWTELPFRQEWMGIYYQDKKVGYSYTTVSPRPNEQGEGYSIANKTCLSLAMLGEEYDLTLDGFSFVDNLYRLKNFELRVVCGEHHLELKGEALGNRLLLSINSAGQIFRKEIELKGEALLANTLTPFYVLPSLYPGRRFTVSLIDPLTLTLGKAEVIVGEKQDYYFRKEMRQVLPVEVKYLGISSRALITEEGELLREETPLGWVMVKEDRTEALKWLEEKKEKVDLAYAVAIPVNQEIKEPERIRELRLRISGPELADYTPRQKIIDRKEGLMVIRKENLKDKGPEVSPAELERYKESDLFIQADDKEIKETARQIIGGETDSWGRVKRLNDWVYKNIKKQPTLSIPSAIEVLKTRQGDCNEHTVLFTALARSLGIPAKISVGVVYLKGYFFYHAWPEVFIGRWISLDPTLGEDIASATHIKFAEGGIEAEIAVAALIGRLKIEVLSYEYESND